MSPDVEVRGSIEVKVYGRSKRVVRLVACPFCGHTFADNEHRWKHFLENHDPEDAGLTPLNEPTPELVTDGGRDVDESDKERPLLEAVERARDAHRHTLGLSAYTARGDTDAVQEHAREVIAATVDVLELVDEHAAAQEGEQ